MEHLNMAAYLGAILKPSDEVRRLHAHERNSSMEATSDPADMCRRYMGAGTLAAARGEPAIHQWPYVQPMQAPLKRYELTDHLGNVNAVVTGRLLPGNGAGSAKQAEVVSATGYESFGSLLPGRTYSSANYRFGFNGKPKDNEVYGSEGTSYDYGFRMYDPRVSRFLSLDPLAALYPFYTPYQFAGNSPVLFIDLDGLERAKPHRNDGNTKIVVKSALDIYTEKHGKVDIYNPRSSYGNKHKGDATGWGFGQEFNPAAFGNTAPFTFKSGNTDNPLERNSTKGEDRTFNNRVDMTPLYPEGNLKMEFDPGTDEKGKLKTGTFEMGIVDSDGNERPLVKTTSNEPGSISTNFKLGEGERLYQRTSDPGMGGSIKTSATRISSSQESPAPNPDDNQ